MTFEIRKKYVDRKNREKTILVFESLETAQNMMRDMISELLYMVDNGALESFEFRKV